MTHRYIPITPLPRYPRRARHGAAKRLLSAVLCAALLVPAALFPVRAAESDTGDTIIAKDFDIAGTGFDTPSIESGSLYYWRDAADGGMPQADSSTEKIPVIIAWNDKYYLRTDKTFLECLNAMAADLDRFKHKSAEYPPVYKGQKLVASSEYSTYNKYNGKDGRWRTYFGQYGTNCSGALKLNGIDTGERIDFPAHWNDNMRVINDAWMPECYGMGFYYHSRHYPMENEALLSDLSIYQDLKATGNAVTASLPANLPFLLDCGKNGDLTQYAIGWQDSPDATTAHFLYGAFNLISARYTTPQEKSYDTIAWSDYEEQCRWKWNNLGDWYLNTKVETPKLWTSNSYNINDSIGKGLRPDNNKIEDRTWNFAATPKGQFVICTDGAWFNNRMNDYYLTKCSEHQQHSQDRVKAYNEGSTAKNDAGQNYHLEPWGYYMDEGWLHHDGSGATFENWLRYWGGRDSTFNIATAIHNDIFGFNVYVGVPQKCNFYKRDITIQSGQTVSIDGPVVLDDGKTITVEDGGVLSVSGWFINNGIINIRPGGKLILQHRETADGDYQEGLINSFATSRGTNNGAILCDGTMIVMSDSTVLGGGNYGLRFGDSAQVINYGTLASENFDVYRSNTIENRGSTSRVFCGWGVEGTGYGLSRVKNDGGSSFVGMTRVEKAAAVKLAANAVYGPRASAVYTNSASGLTVTQNAAERSGSVGSGSRTASGAAIEKTAYTIDFDPADWEKRYFIVPKKVRV